MAFANCRQLTQHHSKASSLLNRSELVRELVTRVANDRTRVDKKNRSIYRESGGGGGLFSPWKVWNIELSSGLTHTATRGGGLTRSSLPSLFAQFLLGKLAGMRVFILELVRLEILPRTDCAVDKVAQNCQKIDLWTDNNLQRAAFLILAMI